MTQRILVINPNSTQAVTDGIDRALQPLRLAGGPLFECVTLREGPPGIQSQRVISTVKHFALNDQETGRMFLDARIGDAAARESDLLAFQLAIERGQGWESVRRAMPSAPALHLGARLVVASLFGLAVMLGLCVLGAAFGGVRLPTASWALLLLIVALCAIPFGAVGLAVGQMLGPNSAAGLWIPLQVLPKFLQTMAPIWPSFHASQLTLRAVGGSFGGSVTESAGVAIAALVATSVVGFSVAILLSRRAAAQTWG